LRTQRAGRGPQAWGRPTAPLQGPLREIGWLLSGVPPRWIGYGGGPLTALRTARHRRAHARHERPVRLHLLELHTTGVRFANLLAWFVNERSRVCTASSGGDPSGADVVWVACQDPLTPDVRARLDAVLAGLPSATPVLNRPEAYDAYHRDDAFPRLAAAGVRVPRHVFGPDDLDRTRVVYKEQGHQGSRKFEAPYRGPVPGYRAFAFEDGSGEDGRVRRYRAFFLAGAVWAEQVVVAETWNAALASVVAVERAFDVTPDEAEQVRLIGPTLGLDAFAVDYLRRRDDGLAVFVDVNVYPTPVETWTAGLRGRGLWHLHDAPLRAGVTPGNGRQPWEVFDEAIARVAGLAPEGRAGTVPPEPGGAAARRRGTARS
jgi:hypothetical protein